MYEIASNEAKEVELEHKERNSDKKQAKGSITIYCPSSKEDVNELSSVVGDILSAIEEGNQSAVLLKWNSAITKYGVRLTQQLLQQTKGWKTLFSSLTPHRYIASLTQHGKTCMVSSVRIFLKNGMQQFNVLHV